MRITTHAQRRGMLLLCLAILPLVAACGAATTATGGSSTTPGAATATVAPAATVTASTALCNQMSLSQVGAVVGGTLTILERGVSKKNGNTAVNCTYLPTPGNGERLVGQISYLFSPNGQAAFAANKQDDASRHETETTLNGLGDAAFWAVSASDPGTLQLSVLKGNVLLIMTLLGVNPNGSSMLNGAIGLARLALPAM